MTVALIDDDAAVLDSLKMLLTRRGLHVECFASADSFLDRFATMAATCIVSDVRMPGCSGLELQAELKGRGSAVPLILITGHGDIPMAVNAIKEGAFDFIPKPFNPSALADAIGRAVVSGRQQQAHHDERMLLRQRFAQLSQRQREVMLLVAEGLSNKEIALQLQISPRTVENYRAWVMEKMEAANLAALVRMVVLLADKDRQKPLDAG